MFYSAAECTLLENLTDDAIALCSEIFYHFPILDEYLTKLYVTKSIATASSVKYSEIRQHFSNSALALMQSI